MEKVDTVPLQCSCGAIRGQYDSLGQGLRFLCMCDDGQAWNAFLGKPELLDAWGGSDVVMCAPSQFQVLEGRSSLRCARLTENGLLRWYCDACRSPWGECRSNASIPFFGFHARSLIQDEALRNLLGAPRFGIFSSYAVGKAPTGHPKVGLRACLAMGWRLARYTLMGQARPNPFVDAHGGWICAPAVVETGSGE